MVRAKPNMRMVQTLDNFWQSNRATPLKEREVLDYDIKEALFKGFLIVEEGTARFTYKSALVTIPAGENKAYFTENGLNYVRDLNTWEITEVVEEDVDPEPDPNKEEGPAGADADSSEGIRGTPNPDEVAKTAGTPAPVENQAPVQTQTPPIVPEQSQENQAPPKEEK